MINAHSSKALAALLGLALLGLVVYGNTFTVPFQFDDNVYVVTNPLTHDLHSFLSPLQLDSGNALSAPLRSALLTRLLGYLTLAINYKVHGLQVVGYHCVNLTLHVINAWLLFQILTHLFRGLGAPSEQRDKLHIGLSFFAASLFLCHPIQTQAVTYITSRFVLVASFFSLFALFAHIQARTAPDRGRARLWKLIAFLSVCAGMLTKEFTFTLPFTLALYEFSFFDGRFSEKLKQLWPYALALPIIPCLILLQAGSLTALDHTMRTLTAATISGTTRLDYALTQFSVVVLYLRLLFLPINQNVDHDIQVQHSLTSLGVIGPALLLGLLLSSAVLAAWKSRRENAPRWLRVFSFGIFLFFIGLSVESSILPLGELAAEYRLYLPSVGVIVAFLAVCAPPMPWLRVNRRVLRGMGIALLAILCVASVLRNRLWGNEISLWKDAVHKSPGKARPNYNLACALAGSGDFAGAASLFQRVISIEPRYQLARNNLGAALNDLGRPEEAIAVLGKAIEVDPGQPEVYYNLGNAYSMQGANELAIESYRYALALRPGYVSAIVNLANANNRIGRFADAAAILEGAYDGIRGRAEGHFQLCVAYAKSGRMGEASRELQAVYSLNPDLGRQLQSYLGGAQ